MKKVSGGVLFSALSLLLLLSFILLLFLEDYKIKGEFQIKLADYYVALSLKEWTEEKHLLGSQEEMFYFKEGSVRLRQVRDKMQYIVLLKGQEYSFDGLMYQETSTDEIIEESTTESNEQAILESTMESIEVFTQNSSEDFTSTNVPVSTDE